MPRLPRALLLLAALMILHGCGKDSTLSPADQLPDPANQGGTVLPAEDLSDLSDIFALRDSPQGPLFSMQHDEEWGEQVVHLPAGSVDGLAAAIAAAGPGGIVVLDEGDHVEHSTVVVDHRVAIFGREGATLTSHVAALTDTNPVVEAALWIRNTKKVVVWGLDIQMAQDPGGTGILVDTTEKVSIVDCTITAAHFGILVEEGQKTRMVGNTVVSTSGWLTGAVAEAHGIVVINGEKCRLFGNDVSNALFGVWACDRGGKAFGNRFHDNLIGLILCNVPLESFPLPDGRVVGSHLPATKWKVRNNEATGNFDAGYLVIDGSARNMLYNNAASNNGTYDIELVGDSMRFGFLTPTSVENRVVAGSYPDLIVKDCGLDNRVIGFQSIVDNGADPCF